MIIKYYDVSLLRLNHKYLEELRYWRNSDKIRSKMYYREFITPEMQKNWFEEINNDYDNLYLIIEVDGKHIGLSNGKNVTNNSSEGGMFIWEDEYLNSHIPVVVSLYMSDWNFYFMGNAFTNCRILKSNKQTIAYNMSLGFRLAEGQENIENQLYTLSLADYETNVTPIRKRLQKIYGNMDDALVVQLEDDDRKSGFAEFITRYYSDVIKRNNSFRCKLIEP